MGGFAVLANEPGRHGFDLVGPFETREHASAWLTENGLRDDVSPKRLIAPGDWKPNDGSGDDS